MNLPELNNLGNLLLDIVTLIVIYALLQIKGLLMKWINAHTTVKQRDALHRMADEAFSFAKTVYADSNGLDKLVAATAYLSSRLKEKGITVTDEEMRAVIEKARLAYKAITTQPVHADQPEKIVEVPAPLPDNVQQLIAAANAFTTAGAVTNPTADLQAAPVQTGQAI